MTDSGYTTITVRPETKEQLDDHRDGRAWDKYLLRLKEDSIGIDVDELADRVIDTIGAEVGGPQVDDSEIAREVARQIDYAHLAGKVADELEGRMR